MGAQVGGHLAGERSGTSEQESSAPLGASQRASAPYSGRSSSSLASGRPPKGLISACIAANVGGHLAGERWGNYFLFRGSWANLAGFFWREQIVIPPKCDVVYILSKVCGHEHEKSGYFKYSQIPTTGLSPKQDHFFTLPRRYVTLSE